MSLLAAGAAAALLELAAGLASAARGSGGLLEGELRGELVRFYDKACATKHIFNWSVGQAQCVQDREEHRRVQVLRKRVEPLY